jgi:hypothetical protein
MYGFCGHVSDQVDQGVGINFRVPGNPQFDCDPMQALVEGTQFRRGMSRTDAARWVFRMMSLYETVRPEESK